MRAVPESRAFYDRKRAEGKRHMQAVITLARRRVNVLWAMLRDGATFKVDPRLGIFIEIRHSERYTFSVASTERCRP